MGKDSGMRSEVRFFIVPAKFLTLETSVVEIKKATTGVNTAFIFRAKREDHAIGFHVQGGGTSPFKRYCRYSYPVKMGFLNAFKTGKARLLDEVDVYPYGIIAVRKFTGTEKVFVADDLPDTGIKITREEFENTHLALKKMAL